MEDFLTTGRYIIDMFEIGATGWVAVFAVLVVVVLVYLLRSVYVYCKRSVESSNFAALCVPVMGWGWLVAARDLGFFDAGMGTLADVGIFATELTIPVFLMLHIWSQTSYKPITALVRIRWLAVPAAAVAAMAVLSFADGTEAGKDLRGFLPYLSFAASIYYAVVCMRAYMFCLNVFYQMPKHMRRSVRLMLGAITTLVIVRAVAVYSVIPQNFQNILVAIGYIIIVRTLFAVFFIANSSNVIVTSRDFVFSSLSTIVMTLSLKGRILDWNHKEKNGCHPLLDPKYKEPYPHYRKRIIDMCGGTISPHDENLLSIKTDGIENYFLFIQHDISYSGRKFGYLVEIVEVTKMYAKLRYFEEIAHYDTLTLLHNRNAYIEYVKEIVAPENMPLLIVVGDVNSLKRLNDTRGHLSGDRLILKITEAVRANKPEEAFAARIGGDEIALLLPNADEQEAAAFISAVTETLNAVYDHDFGTPSISWGYGVMRSMDEDYNDVFLVADAAMYDAKRKSNKVSISGMIPRKKDTGQTPCDMAQAADEDV